MKKLFLLLFALTISIGGLWAQADEFTWAQGDQFINKYLNDGNARRCDTYRWKASNSYWVKLGFFHQKANAINYTTPNNGTWVFPNKGAYTIQKITSTSVTKDVATAYDSNINGWVESYITYNGSTCFYLYTTGTKSVYIYEGTGGPYIEIPSSVAYYSGGNTYTGDGIFIGSPAVYSSVTVQSDNATKGTVSYSVKSGYYYTIDGTYCKHWKNGSTYTLTATPQSGYRFVCWKKGSTQISTNAVTDVTIDGNATYTAYFELEGAPQYTITVQTATPDYCTVSGGGTYYEGEEITISSASKNEHLYIFDLFMLEGEDEDQGEPSFNITVTGNATYTAYYRLANAGTITAATNNASYGTASASLTGSQPGGTAVTLTATPNSGYAFVQWNDGNTDNPRTVYVDGNKTYTAQFVVETPLCAAVKYNTANHEILWAKHGDSDWNSAYQTWWDYPDNFVRVRASDYTDNSMNHIQLCFWVDDYSITYNGTIGPKEGTYVVAMAEVMGTGSKNNYWWLDKDTYLNKAVVGFNENQGLSDGGWNTSQARIWSTSQSPYIAYIANQTCDYCSPTDFLGVPVGSTVKVAKGDGGNCYVEVRNASGRLLFTIGDPASTHALAWDANGGELSGTYTAAGDYEEGTSITAPTATKTGYTFTGWSPAFTGTMPSANTTYTAQWTATTYNLTYEGLEGATNTNPATYNVESETITLADPGARDGYAFTGWTINGTPVTEITHGSTGDKTITANWNAKLSSITLEDNRENSFYNTFKTTYDGESGLIVTYARQFTQGRWSTLCLPFNVNKAMFNTLNFGSRIYEFKYAEGNANDGSGVNLYFSIAKSIEAGKGYIVNADAKLAARTSFTFSGVTMDLSADNGAELNSVTAYDNLTGNSSEGNIELVGTLRKGTLKGTAADNRYMGLKENKIYYPNITTGSTILAYRGIFRSKTGTLNAERIRIIVDGEEKAELEVINGELQDVQETKKFIENGVLYIERNGVIYDATGRKVE